MFENEITILTTVLKDLDDYKKKTIMVNIHFLNEFNRDSWGLCPHS